MAAAAPGRTSGQSFGLLSGAVFVLVGVLGFAVDPVMVFDVDWRHNLVHLAIGALLLYGSTTPATARRTNLGVGIVYLLLAALGFSGLLAEDLLDTNTADHVLHLATGGLASYFGTAGGGIGASPAGSPRHGWVR